MTQKKYENKTVSSVLKSAFPWVSKLHLLHVHWIQQKYTVQDD